MKTKQILPIIVVVLGVAVAFAFANAKQATPRTKVLEYVGRTFTSAQDPDYVAYDRALRDYVARRIRSKFGLSLDPKKYTGFELLEIEALLKCKKRNEPIEPYLIMFQERP